jgi:hypothetical protein
MTSSSMFTSPSESICNPNFNPLKHGYLDAGHGVVGVAGDDGLDKNPRAVGGSLNDNTLEFVITFVLPLWFDANSVADFQRSVTSMRRITLTFHHVDTLVDDAIGGNPNVQELQFKSVNYRFVRTNLEQHLRIKRNFTILPLNG